jgi:hypothetical protein
MKMKLKPPPPNGFVMEFIEIKKKNKRINIPRSINLAQILSAIPAISKSISIF